MNYKALKRQKAETSNQRIARKQRSVSEKPKPG